MIILGLGAFRVKFQKRGGILWIAIGWIWIFWISGETDKKMNRLLHLSPEELDSYSNMGEVKRQEYRRGYEEAKEHYEWYLEAEYETRKKYEELMIETDQLRERVNYFEGLVAKSYEAGN